MSARLAVDPAAPAPAAPSIPRVLQRKCACGGTPGPSGECAECRAKRLGLQRSAAASGPSFAPPIVHDVLRGAGRPLDGATRAYMEPRFGHSFADVRVHDDARAAESARAVGAHAYTVGRDVVFGAGRHAPGTVEGRRLLAHELTHVVQQAGDGTGPLVQRQADDTGEEVPDAAPVTPEDLEKDNPSASGTIESSTDEIPSRDEEDAPLQAKAAQGASPSAAAQPTAGSTGRSLPAPLRGSLERGFGHDFSAVRIHSDAAADGLVTRAGAYAATRGTDIFSRGDIHLESMPWLLAHELAHVVQQQGTPTVQRKARGGAVLDSPAMEREADSAADSIVSGGRAAVSLRVGGAPPVTQLYSATICGRPSTQFPDFPQTYISAINVNLGSPDHEVTLTWTGPNAASGQTGPFRSSPGAGQCARNCDNTAESQTGGSMCTPKGTRTVEGYACALTSDSRATNATFFHQGRGIAFHYFPSVPAYPASHGCVRMASLHVAQLIYDNTRSGVTTVTVGGTWTRGTRGGRPVCY